MKSQADMIFDIIKKEPSVIKAPIGVFDAVIGLFAFFGKWFKGDCSI